MSAPGVSVGFVQRPRADAANRLGFAVKVVGREGYKANDARRWQSGPHLRVSLGYLDRIFDYLADTEIRMYRISSDIAPYVTHPEMPQFHRQIEECRDELAALGKKARRLDLRLSMHPSQYIVLNAVDERIAAAAVGDFVYHAEFLDGLALGPEAKIVTHVGGVYGDRAAAMDRWVVAYEGLPDGVRRRLVLENDEVSWPVADTLAIHARTGVPLVFDNLHHAVLNPAAMPEPEALRACLATWPPGQMPKIHYSTQRVAEREVTRRVRATGEKRTSTQPAKAGQHDEYIDGDQFVTFLRASDGLPFDVMLEAKQKDLALLALRDAVLAGGVADRIW
ncbi:MAG: UV DNA damage repair endonuclease UvsE [Chloroflexia bacterium]|nr:UV DNA damage repair endonuclease UvsE [Chloroflexia bacterium]